MRMTSGDILCFSKQPFGFRTFSMYKDSIKTDSGKVCIMCFATGKLKCVLSHFWAISCPSCFLEHFQLQPTRFHGPGLWNRVGRQAVVGSTGCFRWTRNPNILTLLTDLVFVEGSVQVLKGLHRSIGKQNGAFETAGKERSPEREREREREREDKQKLNTCIYNK